METKIIFTCVHCGGTYAPETIEEVKRPIALRFCPYCDAVVNGEKDSRWLPRLRGRDERLKGFHKVFKP